MTVNEEKPCAWVQERTEQHLDRELPAQEAGTLEAHLRVCAVCAREHELAGRVRHGLRTLPVQAFPQQAAEAMYARIRAGRRTASRLRARHWVQEWLAPSWRPLATAAAVAVLIVTAAVYRHQEQAARAEEVARAERQVRWTLAYLGQVGHRTGLTVRDQVIRARVVDPVQRGVKTALETGAM